MIEKERE